MPLLEELARRNEPWQISDIVTREGGPLDDVAIFAPNQPECLVPMLMRGGTLAGLLVLGARLSEESYSREDRRLLRAVAAQAGVTLENMLLAEDMAERIETERPIARDMKIAKQVQARLFPHWTHSNMQDVVYRHAKWAATITIFWILARDAWGLFSLISWGKVSPAHC
jgi:hypothetical protein